MKKLLSICLAFLVMLSVIPFSVTADAQTGIDLATYVDSVDTESNTVTVGVKAENNSGVRALWITAAYDTNQATLKEVEKKELYTDANDVGACSPLTKNPFEISWAYVTSKNSTYTGAVAFFTFELKEEITCTTEFNLDLEVKEAWDASKKAVASNIVDNVLTGFGSHKYNSEVTNPTCTNEGYTTYTCDCGDSYVDSYVDALGHNYESVVTEPTANEAGYTTHTCKNCGDNYVDSYVTITVGDVNNDGSINLKDLVAVSQYVAMWDVEYYKATMDIDGNGKVDLEDVALFSKYLAGWSVETLIK